MDRWFNADRLHESLGEIPPAEFEQRHAAPSLPWPYALAALDGGELQLTPNKLLLPANESS